MTKLERYREEFERLKEDIKPNNWRESNLEGERALDLIEELIQQLDIAIEGLELSANIGDKYLCNPESRELKQKARDILNQLGVKE